MLVSPAEGRDAVGFRQISHCSGGFCPACQSSHAILIRISTPERSAFAPGLVRSNPLHRKTCPHFLQFSNEEERVALAVVKSLDLSHNELKQITGLQPFASLTQLDLRNNKLCMPQMSPHKHPAHRAEDCNVGTWEAPQRFNLALVT